MKYRVMKKSVYILLAALPLLAGCDMNELFNGAGAGTPISFAANTYYENGPATRTDYSYTDENGSFVGSTSNYERIDWVNGDKMRIWSQVSSTNHAAADYSVTSHSASSDNLKSLAEVQSSTSGSDLSWLTDTDTHTFYALYPSPATEGVDASKVSLNANVITATIPATQVVGSAQNVTVGNVTRRICKPQMKYAYMWAATQAAPNNGPISLEFKPMMTAFEFTIGTPAGKDPLTIQSFSLTTDSSSPVLTGDFTATISYSNNQYGYTVSNVTSGGRSITVNLGGISVSNTNPATFTVFAIPQPNLKNLTMHFTLAGGVTKSVDLKQNGSWVSFPAGKKYRITNVYIPEAEEITYTIEPIDNIVAYGHETVSDGFNVRSYKVSSLTPTVKEAVKWKIQYHTFNGTDSVWVDLPNTGYVANANTTFKINNPKGDGVGNSNYSTGDPRTASIEGTSASTIQGDPHAGDAAREALQAASVRGSQTSPFDLSLHAAYGNINTERAQTTANCYTVSAPGYYMFPCVYGNGITNDAFNVSAYSPGTSGAQVSGESGFSTLAGVQTNKNVDANYWIYYTPVFYNAANHAITSPIIKTDMGATFKDAIVLWQDTAEGGDEIIGYTTSDVWMTTKTVNNRSLDYICFKIDKENIKPGNIVIALRGGASGQGLSGTTNILWSWHIWVTEKDLSPTDVFTNNAGTFSLMPYNLGWEDAVDGTVTRYSDREIEYRVIQVDDSDNPIAGGDSKIFWMTEVGDVLTVDPSLGTNPYYQWGRKDPMFPVVSDTQAKHISRHPDYRSTIVTTGNVNQPTLIGNSPSPDYGKGILNPYVAYYNLIDDQGHGSLSWVGGTYYPWYSQEGWMLTKEDRGPFLFDQAIKCNNAGLTKPSDWTVILDETPGSPTYGNNLFYITSTVPYNFGPYSQENMEILLGIDPAPNSIHFHSSDFYYARIPYAASLRSNSTVVYNLWNSYIYQEDVPNSSVNKFKTIYDPCPPGFTVPTNKVYLGTTSPSQMVRGTNYTVEKSTGGVLPSPSPVTLPVSGNVIGVSFGGMFYPFTGVRSYQTNQGAGYGPNSGNGYYWTDQPFQIDVADDRPGGNTNMTDIKAFSFHHSAYIFSCNAQGHEFVSALTKQFGASIRPMVDPEIPPTGGSSSSPLPSPSGTSVQSW